MSVQKIPYSGVRVESGGVKFGDDWPGLFLRGDNCIDLMNRLMGAKAYMEALVPVEEKQAIQYQLSLAGLTGLVQMILDDVLIKPPRSPE